MLETLSENPYYIWILVGGLAALAAYARFIFNNTNDEYRHKND